MEKASEVYLHSKQNDAMDNEKIILSLSDKNFEKIKRRINVSSKVSSEIESGVLWLQMLRQSTWFTWAA